ncbi:hypothetical protein GJR96_04150 [Haloferax sp. MBLA0076]|uniref:Uncharacterized protein n=1 Tax=Haloferax litoreum TaxID=2666140 RepID=A0A6A8GE35_9EURY|nr:MULTISPECIES: hypothetical protein [Haloferax]KAB1192673.1 hypothetical protein Hfx1148_04140 [Haloferax sp. CBA1148]MRX21149.1 hypothetical protein [Haloferax litoreum]
MNRRAFLSASGLLFLAGCSTQDTTETTTSPPTTTQSTTETPSPMTESPTPPTETETPETTAEPTTEETTTEEPDRVDRILTLVQEDLDAAVRAFAGVAAPDGGFHDLNAAISFPFDDVSDSLFDARGHLGTLEQFELDQAQQRRRTQLRQAHWFLWWTGRTHERLNQVLLRTNNAVSRFYDAEYGRIDTQVAQIGDALDEATESFDSLLDESDASSLDAITELTPDDYTRKVDSLEAELTQFDTFGEMLLTMRNAINRLQRGFDEYLGSSYEDATETFFRAAVAFEDVSEALSDLDPIVALETPLADFVCLSDALAQGSDVLGEAATAGDLDIPERQTDKEDEARTAFESCDLVMERVPIVPAFFDELPEERT